MTAGRAYAAGMATPPDRGRPASSRTRRPPIAHPSDQPPPEAPHRPGWIPRRDLEANGSPPTGGASGAGRPSAPAGPGAGFGPTAPDGPVPNGRPSPANGSPHGAAAPAGQRTWGATRPGWALPAALIAMAVVYPAAFAWQVVPFWAAMGALSGLALYAVFFLGALLVQGTPLWPWIEDVVELTRGAAPAGLAALVIVFGTSPSEEVLWRGAVFARLTRRYGAGWRPVVMTSLAYALFVGLSLSPVLPLAALVCGMVWARQRQVTGSLVPSLVSHALWSLLMFLYIPGL